MHLGCKSIIGGRKFIFGDGIYSQNVVQGGVTLQPDANGLITITGAATVAPDATTQASVVSCDKLIVDGASASLSPSTSSKGLIVFAKTSIIIRNGGRVHINGLGYAGDFGGVVIPALTPEAIARKIRTDALAAYVFGLVKTAAGTAASAMNAGGGGAGAGATASSSAVRLGGSGGRSGSLCGGCGGGGACAFSTGTNWGGWAGGAAGDYGSSVGLGGGNATRGYGGNGGLPGGFLALLSPSIFIGPACTVSADGANGLPGAAGASAVVGAGGGGAGGILFFLTLPDGYSNNGTASANGGSGANAGGVGSVNVFSA